jgi:Tfp pilus assembly protein PilP
MRKTFLIVSVMLAAGTLMAQTAPATAPAKSPVAKPTAAATKPAAKPGAVATKPVAKPTTTAATKPITAAAATKPAAKAAMKPATKVAAKPATKATPAKPAISAKPAAKMTTTKITAKPAPTKKMAAAKTEQSVMKGGRRDPFLNPIKLQQDRASTSAVCSTGGSQCLIIDQVNLLGVVKTQKGMIAMVENASKKQYNLHENDVVLNGKVMKITRDSVVFRESMVNNFGKETTREVVKKVTVPVV